MSDIIYSIFGCPRHKEIVQHCQQQFGNFSLEQGNTSLYDRLRNKIKIGYPHNGWFEFLHEIGHKTQTTENYIIKLMIPLFVITFVSNFLAFVSRLFFIVAIIGIILLLIPTVIMINSRSNLEKEADQFAIEHYIPVLSKYCLNCEKKCVHGYQIKNKIMFRGYGFLFKELIFGKI